MDVSLDRTQNAVAGRRSWPGIRGCAQRETQWDAANNSVVRRYARRGAMGIGDTSVSLDADGGAVPLELGNRKQVSHWTRQVRWELR